MNRTIIKFICLLLALSITASLTGCSFPFGKKPVVSELAGGGTSDGETAPENEEAPEDDEEADGEEAASEDGEKTDEEEAASEDGEKTDEEGTASEDGEETDEDEAAPEDEKAAEDGEEADGEGTIQNGIGRELQATYQADHIFSINTMAGESFNPYSTNSAWNRVASMLVYETLVASDGNFEAQPNLVTRWESEDGILWTFYVDTSRAFHDGGVMTAADAVYSFDAARNGTALYARRFSHVKTDYATGTDVFIVELDEPNWRFYELMNIPCIESGTMGSDRPPGTGPYMFNARGTSLVRFEDHPNAKKLALKTIHLKRYTDSEDILQAFEDSLLDLVTNNPADMSSLGYSSANLIKYVDTTNLHFLGYNFDSPLFSQPLYRSLVTYAIDRETIISTSYQGSAVSATLPIHPNSALYPKSIARTLAYSPDDLKIAMENTGVRDVDGDGVLDFGSVRGSVVLLVCSDSAAKVAAARQIATQLRNAGFEVTMSELEYEEYILALSKGEYDIYYGEVKICNDWDISELVAADGALNYGGVHDPNLEGYIQAFIGSGEDTIQTNTEALYNYLAQSAPITAICFERQQVLYHRGVLTTISPTQDNIFNEIENWTIDLGSDEKK